MGLVITDVDGGRGAHLLCHDSLNDQQLYDGLVDFFTSAAFVSYRYGLVEFTPDLSMTLSVTTVRLISSACITASGVNPDVLLAFVAPKTLHFGLVRMWAAFSEGISWEVMVSRNCFKAEKWLAKRALERWHFNTISLKCG